MKQEAVIKKPEKAYTPALGFIPEPGKPEPMGHGLHWLRLPLPFDLDHINLWLLEAKDGWHLIDTGFHHPETIRHWNNIFSDFLKDKELKKIFVTHFHPDHFGMAGWLHEKSGAEIQMTSLEYDTAALLCRDEFHDELEKDYRAFYKESAIPDDIFEALVDWRFMYRRNVSTPPEKYTPVTIGDTVTLGHSRWKTIGSKGHCPDHACLYNAEGGIFVGGDIVLPDISPNISLHPGRQHRESPVEDYLTSLANIRLKVPDDVLILPSHGVPYRGLHARIDAMFQHHQKRFDRLEKIYKTGSKTAFEIMIELFSHRKLETADMFFALGETLAHLQHELKRGKLVKTLKDGVAVYTATQSA